MPGSEFFAAEKEDSGTALKTRMGSEAVSESFPRQFFPHEMEENQKIEPPSFSYRMIL